MVDINISEKSFTPQEEMNIPDDFLVDVYEAYVDKSKCPTPPRNYAEAMKLGKDGGHLKSSVLPGLTKDHFMAYRKEIARSNTNVWVVVSVYIRPIDSQRNDPSSRKILEGTLV